jgi:uncharacterized membrane protein
MRPDAAPRWIPAAALLLACAWPLALHAAVLLGAPHWVPRLTAAALALAAALWAAAQRTARAALAATGIALAACAAALAAPQLLLYAPPVLINASLAVAFAASLRGSEPVITRFARLEHDPLPPELALYTRRLTLAWAMLFAGMGAAALALAARGSLQAWSTFTYVVCYLLVAALFAGEYAYRRWRFRHYRHASLPELARNVRRAGLFPRHGERR